MRGSVAWFVARRLTALVITIVLAPTVTYTVFTGLSGADPRFPLAVAGDYVVTTFWHFDLGLSTAYNGETVASVLWWSLPADVAMVAGGVACGVALGVAGGFYAALRPRSLGARTLQGAVAFVLASPPYWLGFMVLIFFASGTGYVLELPFISGVRDYQPLTEDPLAWLKSLWMPWLLVGLPLAAAVLRMTEATLRDVQAEDFLRTARAKGLRESQVLRRHALPLAAAPVAALTGANMAILLTNVALMESAFNIPGIFREIRTVYSFADFPLIQAMVIEATALIVIANTLADALQARLDPRVR